MYLFLLYLFFNIFFVSLLGSYSVGVVGSIGNRSLSNPKRIRMSFAALFVFACAYVLENVLMAVHLVNNQRFYNDLPLWNILLYMFDIIALTSALYVLGPGKLY